MTKTKTKKRSPAQARVSLFATDRLLFAPEEVQLELGIGRSTMYRLLATGTIPSVRLGKLIRIRRAELEKIAGIESAVAHG